MSEIKIDDRTIARFDESLPWRRRLEKGDSSIAELERDLDKALKKCTAKQRKFANLIVNGSSYTQAHIKAGYQSKSTLGHGVAANALLKKANVVDAIRLANALYQLQHGVSARWKRQQLIELYANCSEPDTSSWNPTGANKAMQLLMAIDGDGMVSTQGGSNSGVNVTIITGLPERETKVIDHETGTIEHDKT